ncbi:MAG: hypothetical protein AAF913_01280 [Pseudomonadota bacterium]
MIRLSVVLLAAALPATADTPRSAIPWLSESLAVEPDPPETRPPPPRPLDEIEVTPLSAPVRDGAGILPPATTGLPADLWQTSPAAEIARAIREHPQGGVPSTRELFRTLLLAETTPPGDVEGSAHLLARIDRLLRDGRLEEAEALIEAAGIGSASLFRRAFDVGLLTDRSEAACRALAASPSLSPTLPARIFCLARDGDWAAAELTLGVGREVGAFGVSEDALLARFLDPVLYEDQPPPPLPVPLTTLDFVLRDAIALPRPPEPLPLAFLHLDIAPGQPLKTRITAAERLVRSGAVPSVSLLAAYRSGVPAASGGIWDRAAAIRRLDLAWETGSASEMAAAVLDADLIFSASGLRPVVAEAAAPLLRRMEPGTLALETRRRGGELLLLTRDWTWATLYLGATGDGLIQFLSALAQPGADLPAGPELPPIAAAAARGLTRADPPSERAAEIDARLTGGAYGLALLDALSLLAAGTEVDPGDFETGLWLLRRAGLPDWARRIAIETTLLVPDA